MYDYFYNELSYASLDMIEHNATFNLGTVNSSDLSDVDSLYSDENGYDTYTGIPPIVLMYPSDYLYSKLSDETWLHNGGNNEWLLSSNSNGDDVISINTSGTLSSSDPNNSYKVRPSVFIIDSIEILGGNGTADDPFVRL